MGEVIAWIIAIAIIGFMIKSIFGPPDAKTLSDEYERRLEAGERAKFNNTNIYETYDDE